MEALLVAITFRASNAERCLSEPWLAGTWHASASSNRTFWNQVQSPHCTDQPFRLLGSEKVTFGGTELICEGYVTSPHTATRRDQGAC